MTHYGMAIDTKRCVACNRCAMACKVEHNLPNGVLWNRAVTEGGDFIMTPGGTYPNDLSMSFYTLACQHCDNPPCAEVCPTGATFKREDGIVEIAYDDCIGCQSCIAACPYDKIRALVTDPEFALDFKVGDGAVPDVISGTVSKCTFCTERIDRGEQPSCIDLCFAHARYFGDLDNPDSEIAQVLSVREYDQLLVEQGTGPNVFYLK